MKLKHRLGFWPPYAVPSSARDGDIQPGLSDIVMGARRKSGAVESIVLTLKKTNDVESRCSLVIDPYLLDRAIELVEKNPNITLHQLGNLDI